MIAVRDLALLGFASVLAGTSSAQSVEAEEARYSDTEVTRQTCRDEPVREKRLACLRQFRAQQEANLAEMEKELAEVQARRIQAEKRLAEEKEEGEKLEATLRGLKRVIDLQEADKKDEQPQ